MAKSTDTYNMYENGKVFFVAEQSVFLVFTYQL